MAGWCQLAVLVLLSATFQSTASQGLRRELAFQRLTASWR